MTGKLALVLAFCAAPVAAQNCWPADYVANRLKNKYGEFVVTAGVGLDGTLLEFWGNEGQDTWTLVRRAGDVRCVLASGGGLVINDLPPNL